MQKAKGKCQNLICYHMTCVHYELYMSIVTFEGRIEVHVHSVSKRNSTIFNFPLNPSSLAEHETRERRESDPSEFWLYRCSFQLKFKIAAWYWYE